MDAKRILGALSPEEAQAVLRKLTAGDSSIRKKAAAIALNLITDVDVDSVADDVFCELDAIPVEDVWDGSGRRRDGYVDPGECAWRLFEEALDPFLQNLEKCQELGLDEQAKSYCLGILTGIHRFDVDSTSEYKSWAVDAPGEFFASVFNQWKKPGKSKSEIAEVRKFVQSLDASLAKLCE